MRGANDSRGLASPALLLFPSLALFAVFFAMPFFTLLLNSFYSYGRMTGIVEVLTVRNYVKILTDWYYIDIILRTLRLAAIVAVVGVIVGFPIALYLTVARNWVRGLIVAVMFSPLTISVVVRTFGWVIVLGPNGAIDSALKQLGFPGFNILHSELAVVVGMVVVLLPFCVLPMTTSLQSINPAIVLAAQSLGATRPKIFTRIVLPLVMPGCLSAFIVMFALTASSFVTPSILGGSNFKVLSSAIYQEALVLQNWPFAAALSVILLVLVLGLFTLQSLLFNRIRNRVGAQ